MSNPLETSPQQKNKEQPKPNRPEPDNARGKIIGDLMDDDRDTPAAPKPNGADSPNQSLENYWGKPAAGEKKGETSTESSPDGKVTTTNKADGSYTTYDQNKKSVVKVRDAKGAIAVPKGSGIEITEPDGTVKTYSNGSIDIDGSVDFSTEDGTQHSRHLNGSRAEISKDGQIKITDVDGTINEPNTRSNVSDLPYGQDAKIKSIVEKMNLFQAKEALSEIDMDLTGGLENSWDPFPDRAKMNDADNPFVNLDDLYNPDLSKFDLKNPLNNQQQLDLLKIHQEQQRLKNQPLKDLSDLDRLRKEKEDFERDPFGLNKHLPEISDKELKLRVKQEALGMALTSATPEQREQYEQRLDIERADRENPDGSGSLSARLKVPKEQLTPQQKEIYNQFQKTPDRRRAYNIVSAHIEELQRRSSELARLEGGQQSGKGSFFDSLPLPSLSLSQSDKTDAQKSLGRLTGRDLLKREETKTYPNGLKVEPGWDGSYKITSSDFSGASETYSIDKDGKTVSVGPRHSETSGTAADTFNKVGPDGKEIIEKEKVMMGIDGRPEREETLRHIYLMDNTTGELYKKSEIELKPGEKPPDDAEDVNRENIGLDGKIIPEQTGTINVAPNGDLILDLKKNESNSATKIIIKPDGAISRLEEHSAEEMDGGPDDEPAATLTGLDRSADGHAKQFTSMKANGEIISTTLTRKGLKVNTPIKALDGSLMTIGNGSLTIERKDGALSPVKPGELEKGEKSKVWTVNYSSGDVFLERNGGAALRSSTDAKTDSSPDKADNTLYRDNEDYFDTAQYVNEDHSRKVTSVVLPDHKDATITVHTSYDTRNKTLDSVTITYRRKFKKEQ